MKILVLAGGIGTRLWPLSRTQFPKQFLRLKEMPQTIFQMTIDRCALLASLEDLYILTREEYKFLILGQLEEMGYRLPEENILFEPQSKNTLPAIYNGVRHIQKRGEDVVAVMSSDHYIRQNGDFAKSFQDAVVMSGEYLVIFGVYPTRPETGYGYIQPGRAAGPGYVVENFKEKPDAQTAQAYMEQGYLWNSGLFLFRTDVFAQEVKNYAPEVYRAFQENTIEEAFKKAPSISIDYGLIEKTQRAAVVPLKSDWNDLGSFTSLYSAYAKDEQGNVCFDENIMIDASDNLVYSEGNKAIAMVGVQSLVVVDQKDALLVCRKEDTQKVKSVVDLLNQKQDPHAEYHLIVYRPWGSYTVLEKSDGYQIKRLAILPGQRLSYQMHFHRSEHWIVVKGTARVRLDDSEKLICSGESIFVPAGKKHRVENPGKILLELIEIQTGAYLGEDDIIRCEDDYGRNE